MPDIFQSSLKSLKLYNFRNHKVFRFDNIESIPVVITGRNGIGKTNILEAISLISSSKGLKGARISELNNQDNPDYIWNITAELRTVYGPKEVMTYRNVKPNLKSDTRLVQIDGELIKKKTELAELLNIIWLTPSMQQIFIGPSSERRVFFDQIVSNFFVEHSSNLSKYEQSRRERLKLLKENIGDEHWLSALEQNMCDSANLISDARIKTIIMLNKAIEENNTPFPKAILSLINEPLSADFLIKLKKSRGLDASSGKTNLGSHLYDLEVIFKDKNMPARYCSTGEQKALMLNLILAQTYALIEKYKVIPILLFDEIISHLDSIN
ncbi:MAG: AAA family ATPase, partial [Pseudomonadota bacterium]